MDISVLEKAIDFISLAVIDPVDIPGDELGQLGIRIKYRRNPEDRTILNTLAWRRAGNRIHFGISRYNPNDRAEKIQPCKSLGRREAIRHLYEAEKLLYDNNACFALGPNGTIGCCDEEGMGAMFDWFESGGYEKWVR